MSSSIVLIGPAEALPSLRELLDSGVDLHTFAETDALEALDHVIRTKPRIVALESDFAATSRGTALVNRIKDDPTLGDCEVRVVAHEGGGSRVAVLPAGSAAAAAVDAESKKPLDQRGTRRAARVRVRDGVEILVDGNPASLIDISSMGVQVLSARMLKPNQRVRVALSDGTAALRCSGSIAWASYEMPKGSAPRYRAGIELSEADATGVNAYADRHRKR